MRKCKLVSFESNQNTVRNGYFNWKGNEETKRGNYDNILTVSNSTEHKVWRVNNREQFYI